MQDALANDIHSHPSLERNSKRAKKMGLKGYSPMQDLDMRKTCLVSVPRGFASSYSRGKCKMCLQNPQPSFIGKKSKESKVDGFERRYPMQNLDMRKTSLVSVPRDFASSYSRGKCKMRLQMPSTAMLHWKKIQREQSRWVSKEISYARFRYEENMSCVSSS
jgi:hypothetical protein